VFTSDLNQLPCAFQPWCWKETCGSLLPAPLILSLHLAVPGHLIRHSLNRSVPPKAEMNVRGMLQAAQIFTPP